MIRIAFGLTFVAGAVIGLAAMAWWLTRWHDDHPTLDDEPGGGWQA